MFKKVLVANRGEIAVRIIRACREMGIQTVAVCSEADRDALHAQIADDDVCIGPAPSRESYLNPQAILAACEVTGAEAIHPGFGFLSENPAFARMCERCGVTFIGPSYKSMERMGDKAEARKTAVAAGVPVTPGSEGLVANVDEARAAANRVGYPVLIKATAGGGGRGMRAAASAEELPSAFATAKAEALASFNDDRVYVEKFVKNPRHIEIQLLADTHGRVLHLGERDCSIQRRNQKILEESPSPFMDERLRQKMGLAAVRLAESVGYVGAGTIEFLVDEQKNFYFMEMNTRIQVEHPVTEAVTGLDLVQSQIRVAAGEPLPFRQRDVALSGHSIECRINAEDPHHNFRPSPGTIESLHLPGGPGVRVDTALYQGYAVPPFYDSLVAKLIVHAPTRMEAILRMRRALSEFLIAGIATNIDFHLSILRDPEFIEGRHDIGYLGRKMDALLGR